MQHVCCAALTMEYRLWIRRNSDDAYLAGENALLRATDAR
jgi:hypothetical protein